MLGKSIFLVLVAFTVNINVIRCITCTFDESAFGSKCLLFNQTIESDDDMTIIDGSHIDGYSDANVTHLGASNTNISIFPSFLLTSFENVGTIDFSGVEMYNFARPIISCNKLYSVSLRKNKIKVFIGDMFRNCAKLKFIDISSSGVEILESAAFAGTNITELYLQNNNITTLPPGIFEHIPYLESLDLSGNKILEILPKTFYSNPSLYLLRLNENKLTSWSAHHLPELSFLYLKDNNITTISNDAFASMPMLSTLDLSNNFLSEIPTLQGLVRLISLNLYNNTVKHVQAESFNGLKKLQTLVLSYNEIQTINFTRDLTPNFTMQDENLLPKIQDLSFKGNRLKSIDGFILPVKVTSIDFSNNELTYLRELSIQPIAQLRVLHMENNEIKQIDKGFFNDSMALTVFMKNNSCFNDTITIRDIDDLNQNPRMFGKCISHATTFIASIIVLVACSVASVLFL